MHQTLKQKYSIKTWNYENAKNSQKVILLGLGSHQACKNVWPKTLSYAYCLKETIKP